MLILNNSSTILNTVMHLRKSIKPNFGRRLMICEEHRVTWILNSEYRRRCAKVHNAANYQHPLCPRKLYYIRDSPKAQYEEPGLFLVDFFPAACRSETASLLEMFRVVYSPNFRHVRR